MNRDFYSDVYTILIINMDHMRISDTEPSSVILSQTKKFKSWNVMSEKCQIKLKSSYFSMMVVIVIKSSTFVLSANTTLVEYTGQLQSPLGFKSNTEGKSWQQIDRLTNRKDINYLSTIIDPGHKPQSNLRTDGLQTTYTRRGGVI